MPPVIVDTSEWAQYFRVPGSPEATEVRRLLAAESVVMVGVVYAELLRGARNEGQFRALTDELEALPYVEVTKQTWTRVGEILSDLERIGQRIALPDAVIAASALENGFSVFSRDEHFRRVAGLLLHEAGER